MKKEIPPRFLRSPTRAPNAYAAAFGITLGVAVVYFLLGTANYNGDGLGYANLVEKVPTARLWAVSARLLFCPVGRFIHTALASLGWEGRAVDVLQAINSLFGALGAGVFFLAAYRIVETRRLAILAATGLAFSYAYWFWGINATSYPGSVFFQLCCLYLIILASRTPGRSRYFLYAVAIGVAHALSSFFWLTAVLLGPSIALAVVISSPSAGRRDRLIAAATYSAVFLVFLLVPLVVSAVLTSGVESARGFLGWLTTAAHGEVPSVSARNFFRGVIGFSSSVFRMIDLGPYIKNTFWGVPFVLESRPGLYFESTAFVILWATVAAVAVYILRNLRGLFSQVGRLLSIVVIWAAPVVLFGVVWLGSDTERWLALLPAFWLLMVMALWHIDKSMTRTRARSAELLLWGVVLAMFSWNLGSRIIPDHNPDNNRYLRAAKLLSGQMAENDLVILWGHDHIFTGPHLAYFFDKKALHLDTFANRFWDDIENQLTTRITAATVAGGRVFVSGRILSAEEVPEARYSASEYRADRRRLQELFSRWSPRRAFTIDTDEYWELDSAG